MKTPSHPMQPVVLDENGVGRFQKNEIVSFLLDWARQYGMNLNELAKKEFPDEDRQQFAQLIGYSVCGYNDLSYAATDGGQGAAAQKAVEALVLAKEKSRESRPVLIPKPEC